MITEEEYELIANWIKENTCGCIWSNFTGTSLKESLDKYKEMET